MVMLIDVSQKVYLDWFKEIQEYKDQMLAQITHDLRTPLNGVICQLQASGNFQNIDDYQSCIDISLKNSYLLLNAINDILDYSQSIKGKLRIVPEDFDMIQLLQDVIDLLKPQAQMKNIELRIQLIGQLQEKTCLIIQNDQNRIRQIVLNLIGNALKFTFQGYIQLTLELKKFVFYGNEEDILQISVQDTGVGIPEELKNKLFQVYGTFDHKKGTNTHGLGLGLTICKQLVSLTGPSDQIELKSQVNVGSCFTFSIFQNLTQNKQEILKQIQKQQIRQSFQIIDQNIYISPQCKVANGQKDEFSSQNQMQLENLNDLCKLDDILIASDNDNDEESQLSRKKLYEMKQNLTIPNMNQSDTQYNQKCKSKQRMSSDLQSCLNLELSECVTVPFHNVQINQLGSHSTSKSFKLSSRNDFQFQAKRNSSSTYIQLIKQLLPIDNFKILVVDDNPYNILGIETLLKQIPNITIEKAFNGQQGVDKVKQQITLQQQSYFLILMDVNMPVLGGNEAISQIRQLEQQFHTTNHEIASLTAYQQEKDKQKCYQAGSNYFLNKPLTYQQLISVLKQIQNKMLIRKKELQSEVKN